MSEFSDVIKVIIDKGGFKTFLFSVAVALISQKLWLNDWLWSVVVFCGCFLLVSFIVWICEWARNKYESAVYEDEKKKAAEEARDSQYNRFCIIYNSLPPLTQQRLIELYKLPQETYSNVRILNNMPYQYPILQVCYDMSQKYQVIDVEESVGSPIITIEGVFYNVLEKHAADFE